MTTRDIVIPAGTHIGHGATKSSRSDVPGSVLIGIGNDHTAELTIDPEAIHLYPDLFRPATADDDQTPKIDLLDGTGAETVRGMDPVTGSIFLDEDGAFCKLTDGRQFRLPDFNVTFEGQA